MRILKDNQTNFSTMASVPGCRIPNSSKKLSPELSPLDTNQYNVYNKKRPLKINSKNLAFEGLSFNRVEKEFTKAEVEKAMKAYEDIFGSEAAEKLKAFKKTLMSPDNKDVEFNGDKVIFKDKAAMRQIAENAVSPVTTMPIDIANYFVKVINKMGLGETKFGQNLANLKIFKNRQAQDQYLSELSSFREIVETGKDDNKKNLLFEMGLKRMDPKKTNYSSDAERSLTRLVTGMTSAFFLADDAYNLSRVINDNPKKAKKDKKHRFNQEIARVVLTSYLTLVTLGSMKKVINKKAWTAVLAIVGSAAVAEIVGRIMSGTPVLPISEQKAKDLSLKQSKKKKGVKAQENKTSKQEGVQKDTAKAEVKGKDNKKADENQAQHNHKKFTTKKALKWLGIITVAGFGIRKGRETKAYKEFVKNDKRISSNIIENTPFLKSIQTYYKEHAMKETKYSKEDIQIIMSKLEKAGFKELAETYDKLLSKSPDGSVNFGSQDKKIIKSLKEIFKVQYKFLYEQTLLFPGKVLENTINLFTKKTQKEIHGKVLKKFEVQKYTNRPEEEVASIIKEIKQEYGDKISDEEIKKIVGQGLKKKSKIIKDILKNSIKLIKDTDEKDLKKVVSDRIFGSMDTDGKSNYSNADLGVSCKVWCSAITSLFLIADNYNLVMINSAGKDKKDAQMKAKERAVQRGFDLFYSKIMMQVGNGFFRDAYNASLAGASAVNIMTQAGKEVLTRKSIGMPITESTKEKIYATEAKNQNATGIKGKYFKTMSYITGKKTISQQQKAKQEKEKAKA